MKISLRTVTVMMMALILGGCAGLVRQSDLDAWVGQPVAALDQQSFFLTLPMIRTKSTGGVEIRNYVNGRNIGSCFGSGYAYGTYTSYGNYSATATCIGKKQACNSIFYIKNGKVLEYRPTGSGGAICFTDSRVLPPAVVY